MTDDSCSRRTAAAGRAPDAHAPAVSAARARRWGAWYYAEQVLRVMKGYGWTIVMYGVGQPVAYLFAMGVGLATLVSQRRRRLRRGQLPDVRRARRC